MSDDPGSINPADLPPAAQWMLAQAEAARPEPPERTEPRLSFTPLAERERRVAGGLRSNRRLTKGLDDATAGALRDWAAAIGTAIAGQTAGLDDAAAEPILQARARAARTLLRAATRAAADPTSHPARLSDIAPRLTVLYPGVYAPPGAAEVAPFLAEWAGLAGQPAARIAALRAFIDAQATRTNDDERRAS